MIETEDLSKQFGAFWAVDGVSLRVRAGEVLALLGPNGAGKTTTVRMLTSVLIPTRGYARVAGFDVVNDAQQVRRLVGVLTENHGLYNRMPARDYLDFFGQLYGMPEQNRRHRIESLLELFGIAHTARQPIGEFSKGMRQKLALARCLLHNPPVLLLDEPTSAMDPESARLVRDAINDLRSEERAVIICTHNLSEAEELADRIAIIRQGRIVASGPPAALKDRLLGPPEYLIQFGEPLNGWAPDWPPGTEPTGQGPDWVRFRSEHARDTNPRVLQNLLAQGLPVVSLQEVPRSLELVYLKVMSVVDGGEELHVG